MTLTETIRICGKGDGFISGPLPVPARKIISVMAKHGHNFGNPTESTLSVMLHDKYDPRRLPDIERIVALQGWDVDVERAAGPNYDDADFTAAALWHTSLPGPHIGEIEYFEYVCDECGTRRTAVDTTVQVEKVNSKLPLCAVNGVFDIVNPEARRAIEDSLTGAEFHPFDKQGRYFYLRATHSLGEVINTEEDFIDYRGRCSRCGFPRFKSLLAPLRFEKEKWQGEDIIAESFFDGILVTPKAFAVLRRFNKQIHREGIALLE